MACLTFFNLDNSLGRALMKQGGGTRMGRLVGYARQKFSHMHPTQDLTTALSDQVCPTVLR